MNPVLSTEIATAHHADLLRTAQRRRRAALASRCSAAPDWTVLIRRGSVALGRASRRAALAFRLRQEQVCCA